MDIFDAYFRLRANTEPAPIFHRWALLGILGAWLGRGCWMPFGEGRIFPNQYLMFVGEPGSRKSTAIKQASKLLLAKGYTNFAPKKTSKEQYLADLSEDSGKSSPDDFDVLAAGSPVESFINADEFNIFMGPANLEFQALLGDLWDWDSEQPWQYRLKTSKHVSIYQPTINILGGNTPQSFSECFPPATLGQGFMSRMILIYGERTDRKIPFPETPDQTQVLRILDFLGQIRKVAIGPLTRSEEATDALKTIYQSWPGIEDTRFTHYNERRFTHLLKLCILHAAARLSRVIDITDVVRSNTVLAHAESVMPKAAGEMGKSKSSEAASKVMQTLYNARKPMTAKELWSSVRTDLEKPADLTQILNNLLVADKIQAIPSAEGGVPGYLPKLRGINRKVLYVDPKWLKGVELP